MKTIKYKKPSELLSMIRQRDTYILHLATRPLYNNDSAFQAKIEIDLLNTEIARRWKGHVWKEREKYAI